MVSGEISMSRKNVPDEPTMKRILKYTVVGFFVCFFLVVFLAKSAKSEPFPEHMKGFKGGAMEFYTYHIDKGVEVIDDKWIITWSMATEWFPELGAYNYIVFEGRYRTTLPPPPEHRFRIWLPPKPKKKEK